MPSQPTQPEQRSSGISPLMLAIASASSVVAAIVVSRIWGAGTLIGAAVTPIIVTLVSEALKKPAERITVIRISPTGTRVHEREAPPTAAGAVPAEMGERSVHRTRRPALLAALATGLVAFVIGAVVLTSSELVFGDSSVASGGKRTTILGGEPAERTAPDRQEDPATTTQPAPATEAPAPEATEPAEPVPEVTPVEPAPEEPPAVPEQPPATGTT